MTLQEVVKRMNDRGSHFWSKDTLKFFGDTVESFAIKEWNGNLVLYRKLGSSINVFGKRMYSDRSVGANSWYAEGDDCRTVPMSDEETNQFYDSLEEE